MEIDGDMDMDGNMDMAVDMERGENGHVEGPPEVFGPGWEGLQNFQMGDLRFERAGFFVMASILAWFVFWDLADRHQEEPFARALAWACVVIALWAAQNL